MKNSNNLSDSYLIFDWANKPGSVNACSTLVSGGFSVGNYAEFNLATHVGDKITAVIANRKKLITELKLPAEPVWLEQVHSDLVIDASQHCCSVPEKNETPAKNKLTQSILQADASVSITKGVVCAVLTADCLPVFFCNTNGTEVAVAHAGWRGLHAGIISRTIQKMNASVEDLLIYFGPAIGAQAFEVGKEVKQAFAEKNNRYVSAFKPVEAAKNIDHYLCDIYELARIELELLGVDSARVSGGKNCTYSEKDRFYSYRRQKQTGRMANLIWLT